MAKSNEKIKVADLSKLEATLKAKNMAEEDREEILNLAEKRQKKIIESNKQEERLKGIQSKGGATKFFKKAELIKKIQARDLEEFFKKYENEDGKTYDKLVEAMFPGFEDYKNEKITDEEEKRLTAKEDKRIQDFKDQKAAHEAKLQARRKDLEKYLESLKKEEEEGEELLKQEKINEEKKKKNRTKTKKVTAPEPVTAKPEEENLVSITLVDGEIRNLKKGDKFHNKYDHKNYEIIGPHTSKDGKALIKAVNVEKRDETFFTTKEEFATNFDKGTFDIPADDERIEKLNNIFAEERNKLQEEQERELSGEILVTVNNLDDIPVNLRRGDMFWYKHKQYRITKEGTRKTKKEDKLLILAENADNASEVLELTPEEFVNDYNENRISIKPSDKIREEMKNFERERKAREALNSTPEKIEENVAKIAELIKEFGISQVVIHSGVDFEEKDEEGNKKFNEEYFNQKKKDQKFQNPWTADLDTQAALLILNEFNEKSLGKIYTENAVSSYIPKGGKEKNIADKDKRSGVKLFLDVGGNWLRFEKDGENTTIYLDHHGEEKKEPTSAAEMMYKIMSAADLLKEKPEWLNKLVTLVNDVDNLSYLNKKNEDGTKIIDEKYFREVWPNSLYAIAEKIPFKILKEWFESGLIKNADRVFSEKDLRGKIGRTKIRVREKLVNDKMEVVDIDMTVAQLCKMREREAGGAIKGINNAIEQNKKNNLNTENTRLGKILVHDHFIKEDGKPNFILDNVAFTAAKSMGFDTIVNWDPKTKIFKINSSHENLEAIGKELQNEFVGTNVVRGVFVFGPKDKDACENITIERILDIIDRNINKKEEKVPTKNSEENKTTVKNPETKNTENTSIEKELSELEKLIAQEDANRIILIEAIKAGNRPEVRRIQELNFAIFKKKKELLNTKIENTENKEEVKIIEEIKENNSEIIENAIESQENLEKTEVAEKVEKAPEDPTIIIEEKEKEIEISPSGIIRRDPEEILAEPVENTSEEKAQEELPAVNETSPVGIDKITILEEPQQIKVAEIINSNTTDKEREELKKEFPNQDIEKIIETAVIQEINDKQPEAKPKNKRDIWPTIKKVARKVKNNLLILFVAATTFETTTSFRLPSSRDVVSYNNIEVNDLKDWENIKLHEDEINKLENISIITKAHENSNDQYLIVDKQNGKTHLYKGDSLIDSYNCVLGDSTGDEQTFLKSKYKKILQELGPNSVLTREASINEATYMENGRRLLREGYDAFTDWGAGNMKTGAGIYTIGAKGVFGEFGNAVFLNNERGQGVATSLHYNPHISDRSPEFRFTNGCVGFDKQEIEKIYSILHTGDNVYVLPDDPHNKYQLIDGELRFLSNQENVNKTIRRYEVQPIMIMAENPTEVGMEFLMSVSENKEKLMKLYPTVPNSVYNELAKIAYGILGKESSFGTYGAIRGQYGRIRDVIGTTMGDLGIEKGQNLSVGVCQIRINSINQKVKDAFNIKNSNDLYDTKINAVAALSLLLDTYENSIPNSKKSNYKILAILNYNDHSSFRKIIKNETTIDNLRSESDSYIKKVLNFSESATIYSANSTKDYFHPGWNYDEVN